MNGSQQSMQWIFNAGSQLVLITFVLRGLKFGIDTLDKSDQEIAWWYAVVRSA